MRKVKDDDGKVIGRGCEGCIFLHDTLEPECGTGRLQKFATRNETVDGLDILDGPVLTRLCNMYRGDEWSQKQSEDISVSFLDEIELARREVENTFMFVMDTKFLTPKQMWNISQYIQKQEYDHSKIGIVYSANMGENVKGFVHMVNVMRQEGFNAFFVMHTEVASTQKRDYEVLVKGYNYSHIVVCREPTSLRKDLLHNIDNDLNDNLEKVLLYTFPEEAIDCIAFTAINGLYPNYQDFYALVDSMPSELEKSGTYKINAFQT